MLRKVLIITYYWPPSGGAGVQRWLHFSRYLREYGWEPVIYTPSNPEAPGQDESLLAEAPENLTVIKRKIREPYSFYKAFSGKKGSIQTGFLSEEQKREGLADRISLWIRSNLFIPDARCWWIRPSARYLRKYLRKNPVDALISTGPPHSMHRIALRLKRKRNIPWIADFRDPWTGIDYFKDLRLSPSALKKHQRMEKQVLNTADKSVAIGPTLARNLAHIGGKEIAIVPNGYDPAIRERKAAGADEFFRLTHIGSINKDRNHPHLWEAVSELCREEPKLTKPLRISLVGKTDHEALTALAEAGLSEKVERTPYLPHNKAIEEQRRADVLLLLVNNVPGAEGILTGKVYEYLAAGKPILAIGKPGGDLDALLQKTGCGELLGFEDKKGMKSVLKSHLKREYKTYQPDLPEIERFSRKNLCREYASLLNEVSHKA